MKKIIFGSFFLLALFFSSIQIASAASYACQCTKTGAQSVVDSCATCTSKCSPNSCTAVAGTAPSTGSVSGATLPNPLGTTNINTFAARIISYILGLVGTISLLLFIYGGLIWMTSAGNAASVKKGRDILVWAVIGMAVVFTSYILVKFVIQGVQGTL